MYFDGNSYLNLAEKSLFRRAFFGKAIILVGNKAVEALISAE